MPTEEKIQKHHWPSLSFAKFVKPSTRSTECQESFSIRKIWQVFHVQTTELLGLLVFLSSWFSGILSQLYHVGAVITVIGVELSSAQIELPGEDVNHVLLLSFFLIKVFSSSSTPSKTLRLCDIIALLWVNELKIYKLKY